MPKKILLADDSITIQKVVELTFSDGDYEVIAVNNGAKAIQKLSEMRPDIILSDIIMPEKNGYEVCEYVKSHPEYRNIPVVLLTGTFEPFDPDRADKAGCDAVVTKPFESQSLIHRVEDLIRQGQGASAPAAQATPQPATPQVASPWSEEPVTESQHAFGTAGEPQPSSGGATAFGAAEEARPFETPSASESGSGFESSSSFGGDAQAFEPAPGFGTASSAADSFGAAPEPHGSDIFGSSSSQQSAGASDMPFETAPPDAFSGETRAFPKMSFEDMQRMAAETSSTPAAPAASDATPWGEEAFSGETRAFQRMSFDDVQSASTPQAQEAETPQAEAQPESIPFEPPAFDDITSTPESQTAQQSEPAAASPWDEQPAFSGETRAFPRMSFDDLQKMAAESTPAAPAEPSAEAAPWDEQPSGGETRAFPRMSFEDLQKMASEPAPSAGAARSDSPVWDEPAPSPSWPPQASGAEPAPSDTRAAGASDAFASTEPEAFAPHHEEAFAADHHEPFGTEAAAPFAHAPDESPFAAASAPAETAQTEKARPSAEETAPAAPAGTSAAGDLTEEQIDRIARRVVQLMSSDLIRTIAWEVIPDMAEMVVKERIRQLESEA